MRARAACPLAGGGHQPQVCGAGTDGVGQDGGGVPARGPVRQAPGDDGGVGGVRHRREHRVTLVEGIRHLRYADYNFKGEVAVSTATVSPT